MKFNLMKKIDKYLGFVLGMVIYIYGRLFGLFCKKDNIDLKKIKKIVILKWFGLGTIIKMSPLIEAISLNFPNTKIVFYTFPENYEILKILDICHEIKIVNNTSFIKFFKDVLWYIFQERLKSPDLVLDMEFCSNFSTIFSFLTGSSKRIGFDIRNYFWYRRLSNLTIMLNDYDSLKDIYLEIGRMLGLKMDRFVFKKRNIQAIKKRQIDILLEKYGIKQNDLLIGINVNARDILLIRRWPADSFVYLIDILNKNFVYEKWKIILVGSSSERRYIEDNIINKLEYKDNVFNLAGILDLECLFALIERFKIFISNDSGPLYIAMMQNIPTVSFWGPTSPVFNVPINEKMHKYFYTDIGCNFCFDRHLLNPQIICRGKALCMSSIKPQEVSDYILKELKKYGI